MALYVLFENKNTFLFLYYICLLLNLQMRQIILPGLVYRLCVSLKKINWCLYGHGNIPMNVQAAYKNMW